MNEYKIKIFYSDMLYPAAAALVSGAVMYTVGANSAQKKNPTVPDNKNTPSTNEPTLAKVSQKNNTFTDDAITPILRRFPMN